MSPNERRAEELADAVRQDFELGDAPIADLFELVYKARGVDVLSMDASQDEHGLTMTHPTTKTTIIAVATTPHPMRQRSSIAHELGHVLAGDLDRPQALVPGERSDAEICADAFARHLLIPKRAVQRHMSGSARPIDEGALSDLVQRYGVSPAMAAIQLRHAGLIDQPTCADWMYLSSRTLATRYGWLDQYLGLQAESMRPRAPQGLMQRAVAGYRAGLMSLAELSLWYGRPPAELEAEIGPQDGRPSAGDDLWDDGWDPGASLFPEAGSGDSS